MRAVGATGEGSADRQVCSVSPLPVHTVQGAPRSRAGASVRPHAEPCQAHPQRGVPCPQLLLIGCPPPPCMPTFVAAGRHAPCFGGAAGATTTAAAVLLRCLGMQRAAAVTLLQFCRLAAWLLAALAARRALWFCVVARLVVPGGGTDAASVRDAGWLGIHGCLFYLSLVV